MAAWTVLFTAGSAVAAVPGVCPPPTAGPTPLAYAIDANWNMLLYRGDGQGHLTGGTLAWPSGGLWRNFHGIAVADFNGDGWADVAGDDAYGDMRLYAGTADGHLVGGTLMWPSGGNWAAFQHFTAADFDGDGKLDLAAIDEASGNLVWFRNDGTAHLTAMGRMWPGGQGVWGGFTQIASADFTGDGRADVVGMAAGHAYLYRGDGAGRLALASGQDIAAPGGWSGYTALTAADFTTSGYASVAGVTAAGDLRLYTGDGTGHTTATGPTMYGGPGVWGGFHYVAASAPNLPALCPGGVRLAVWPLGDSITYGYQSADGDGYRRFLADRLNTRTPNGWLYEGSAESGPRWWSHEGHGGFRIDQLAGLASSWLPLAPNGGQEVNLITLDAGSNDAGQGLTGAQMLASMSSLLDVIRARDAAARVEVAQITINGQTPAVVQAETDFNAGLPALVAAKGAGVTVVDMRGVHLSPDGVHPDDAGYQDMAGRWVDAATAVGWLP
jgi:lysophospholipase L1-like esterase